ncbi:MAG: serine/threonine protein kinase [Leptolyngbyaceae cyanobacterium SM1_1_3]|nr:serine/threonine protein kinase [Leptolyngbyaceae cyanobacterium SM1_1_3]NJN03332.1 serine/threonine protein kinase [Leptolyngbyaceae cyanobacterium RM1_1_2]NJO11300.1 serine/threonine protein kinase [Leptolyngbyaceae cyanobacterium SL_1_1]
MQLHCTRPSCPRPINTFADLDTPATLKTVQQKFCVACGMPLVLGSRYLPLKLLGKGGFGAAYLACDRYTPTMRQCVVKQFQPSGNLSPEQLRVAQDLFEREAQVLEVLGDRHPQIPDLYAFFPLIVPGLGTTQQEELFYLVQEFIDGQDLEQELEQQGAFSEAAVLEILSSILKVLTFVHENHTIHRDIKPSNIMRRKDGRLYLLDFGAVKQVTQGQSQGAKSTGIYSMGFAPPEQMSGGAVYPSTDLYALAVTCVTLVTGKPAGDLYDSYRNTWDWQQGIQVSPRLASVLNRMLKAAPDQRFASAKEVLQAVTQVPPIRQSPSPQSLPSAPPVTPSPPASSSPAPPPPRSPASPSPVQAATAPPRFSLLETLGGAAFTGFEGGLAAVALGSFLGTTLAGSGAWLLFMAVLVILQWRRVIERVDLLIVAAISLGIVLILRVYPWLTLLILALIAALVMVAIATVFWLVYRIVSRFF